MILQMSALEQALSSIEEIGKGELQFEVNGISLTLRTLSPEEDLAVQRYASQSYQQDEDDADATAAIEYIDRFRMTLISYALVELNGQNFRGVEFFETGEVLDNGVRVKVPKHEALRKLIQEKWSSSLRQGVFKKYGELTSQVERKAESAIEFEPSDIESEIQLLEEKLKILKEQRDEDQEELKEKHNVEDLQTEGTKFIRVEPQPQQEENPVDEEFQSDKFGEVPGLQREPVIPATSTPPQNNPMGQPIVSNSVDSFGRSDSYESDIDAENERLFQEFHSQPSIPPHAAAAQVHHEVENLPPNAPVFQTPMPDLNPQAMPQLPPQQLEVNQTPQGSKNPRFTPPGK